MIKIIKNFKIILICYETLNLIFNKYDNSNEKKSFIDSFFKTYASVIYEQNSNKY